MNVAFRVSHSINRAIETTIKLNKTNPRRALLIIIRASISNKKMKNIEDYPREVFR